MVESSCWGTSCYAYSSHWTNEEGGHQTVYCEGTFNIPILGNHTHISHRFIIMNFKLGLVNCFTRYKEFGC